MKKRNIKLQLASMNNAMVEFADKKCREEGLRFSDANTIRQRVLYGQPYNNMEVFRTSKLYKTLVNRAGSITSSVAEIKSDREE